MHIKGMIVEAKPSLREEDVMDEKRIETSGNLQRLSTIRLMERLISGTGNCESDGMNTQKVPMG